MPIQISDDVEYHFVNIRWMPRRPSNRIRSLQVLTSTIFCVGGLLLVWSAYIHFHLWRNGYSHIPTVGPLFLVQSIVALVLGVVVMTARTTWSAIVGVGFAASTLAGFVLSVERGLFGFKDSWSAPYAHLACALEIVTILVLATAGASCSVGQRSMIAT
jgi:hypothetical protein